MKNDKVRLNRISRKGSLYIPVCLLAKAKGGVSEDERSKSNKRTARN